MKEILALGASGLVGSRFIDLYYKDKLPITPRSTELDITKKEKVMSFFKKNKDNFDVVINFAGYTDVDGAESQRGDKKGLAWQVNVEAVKNIAEAAQKHDKYLIHISTDFVFPGDKADPGPYSEDKKLSSSDKALGWYGFSKLKGEEVLGKVFDNFAIVRISYPFRTHFPAKLDFARSILSLYDEGKLYPMFADQKLTPTFIDEAAKVLYLLVEEEKKGIYHVASTSLTSPYEFALYLLEKARGVKNAVKEGSMEEFLKAPGRTKRPLLGGLSTEKTQKKLGVRLMDWKEAIDKMVKEGV